MEDVFKFLLIAAVIVIGIARQFKKEASKNADNGPVMPTPEEDHPLPENWGGGTYGGYIPEGPQPEPVHQVKQKKTTSTPKPFRSGTSVPTNAGTSSYKPTSAMQSLPPLTSGLQEFEEPADSEFAIHSAEEARRAIVWSEILQRKY